MLRLVKIVMVVCIAVLMAVPAIAGTLELISVSSTGEQGNRLSLNQSISSDGRFVSFVSWADNLVVGDTNYSCDIVVHDRQTGLNEIVSVSSTGELGNAHSYSHAMSADGRFVAFQSGSTNLVQGVSGWQIYIHDRETGLTELVSVSNAGLPGGGDRPSISADGRFVVFDSTSSSILVPGIFGRQLYVRDRQLNTTIAISVNAAGQQGNSSSSSSSISGDGRFIAFSSTATNLVPNDTNRVSDVFIYDMNDGSIKNININSNGEYANGSGHFPKISLNGNVVVFSRDKTHIVSPSVLDYHWQIYTHDLTTGETELNTFGFDGAEGNAMSYYAGISGDGRYLAFSTKATNIVPSTLDNEENIILADRLTGEFELITISPNSRGRQVPALSFDGKYIAFSHHASNLVPVDTNRTADIFVYTRDTIPQTIEETAALLDGLVDSGLIDANVANSLLPKLEGAFTANNTNSALGSLGSFINQINAQRGKKIDDATADELIAIAEALIAQFQ